MRKRQRSPKMNGISLSDILFQNSSPDKSYKLLQMLFQEGVKRFAVLFAEAIVRVFSRASASSALMLLSGFELLEDVQCRGGRHGFGDPSSGAPCACVKMDLQSRFPSHRAAARAALDRYLARGEWWILRCDKCGA